MLNDLESLKEDGLDKENGASEPKGNKNAGGRFQGLDIEDDEVMEADGNDDELETVTSSKKNKKDKKKRNKVKLKQKLNKLLPKTMAKVKMILWRQIMIMRF